MKRKLTVPRTKRPKVNVIDDNSGSTGRPQKRSRAASDLLSLSPAVVDTDLSNSRHGSGDGAGDDLFVFSPHDSVDPLALTAEPLFDFTKPHRPQRRVRPPPRRFLLTKNGPDGEGAAPEHSAPADAGPRPPAWHRDVAAVVPHEQQFRVIASGRM